jgi:hypothetical protein
MYLARLYFIDARASQRPSFWSLGGVLQVGKMTNGVCLVSVHKIVHA